MILSIAQNRSSLCGNKRGTAFIEFALVLPFLVLLFLGGFQLMDAVSAFRKMGRTVRTLADLTTQSTSLTSSDADTILNASRQVMAPYSTTSAVLRITEIQVKSNGQSVVVWSRALNGAAYTAGSSITIPNLIATPNSYYVYSEMSYNYVPLIASQLVGTIPLNQSMYMSPRKSDSITYS
jgi:Flp pilus assembly protein TadG